MGSLKPNRYNRTANRARLRALQKDRGPLAPPHRQWWQKHPAERMDRQQVLFLLTFGILPQFPFLL